MWTPEPDTLFEKLVADAPKDYIYTSAGAAPPYQQWPLTAGTSNANVLYATNLQPATYTSASSILNK